MQYIERLIFLSVFLFAALSCENRENQAEKDYFIEWDNTSLICIAEEGGYPRLIKLVDESLLAVYENRRGDVVIKKSFDNGSTWSDPVVSFEAFNFTNTKTGEETRVNIANPEIIQLPDGDLLLAVNLRPRIEGIYPFS
ncbi:MAG: sialidase family protein, partial [Fermentimonas sp.]|nr:sialidase family protein [Fermentimonas sp.]